MKPAPGRRASKDVPSAGFAWLAQKFQGAVSALLQATLPRIRRPSATRLGVWECLVFPDAMDVWMRNAQAARALASALPGGGRVLEVGSGLIGLGAFLDPARYTILRVDIRVRRFQPWLGLGRDLVKGSATALPFARASFDAVVAVDVIEHIPRARRALAAAELRRASRGPVILHCPAQSADRVFTGEEDDTALAAWFRTRFGYGEPNLVEHIEARHPTLEELLAQFPGAAITGSQPSAFWLLVARESRLPLVGLAATIHHRRQPSAQAPFHALLLEWSPARGLSGSLG